ncbi:hypothetical protein GCM10010211_01470 [Streptomyces albospinus]|uniref:Secreted protein n=1 Tax=Streptomyces albospinus TaxID=285515 RepID=A0ABQ2UNE3_9ACTN|nr:hypothetical protein GCM10010211_01470 [Streptomyces albospinus]
MLAGRVEAAVVAVVALIVVIAEPALSAALFTAVAAGGRPVRGEVSAARSPGPRRPAYGVVHKAPPYGAPPARPAAALGAPRRPRRSRRAGNRAAPVRPSPTTA